MEINHPKFKFDTTKINLNIFVILMVDRLQVSFQLCQSSLLEMNYEHDSDALETVDRDHNRFHETVELIRYLCPSNATT